VLDDDELAEPDAPACVVESSDEPPPHPATASAAIAATNAADPARPAFVCIRVVMAVVVRGERSHPGAKICDPAVTEVRHAEQAMRVLVVEDHVELAESVARVLRREGMAVDIAGDGHAALARTAVIDYDVVVLDRDLPGAHGDDVCRSLVAEAPRTRVLMLTASGTIGDRVEGLSIGADDYVSKPFAFAELVARIRALGRRAQPAVPPILEHGDVRLDPARRVATRAGARLALSPKELAVLEYLLGARGRAVSAEELLERVWDEAADPFTTTVKATINRLRAKLGDPPLIETVPQGGYRI
jgi:DNA-binding response OmpR family regulator